MTQPNYQLGIKARLLVNTGVYGTPVWTPVNGISDLTVKPAWDKTDANTRASRIKRYAKTLMDLTVSGKIKVDHTDTTGYVAFLGALHSDSPLDLLILDGDPTESSLTGTLTGYRADFLVTSGDQGQTLTEVIFESFELVPAISANPVSSVSVAVAAGVPTYTYTAL